MEKYIKSKSFADAYKITAFNLMNNCEYETAPRNYKIKEILNYTLCITNPYSNLFFNEKRCPSLKYLKSELKLYFSADNLTENFTKASKFWGTISDNGVTTNSAYGYLLFKDKNIHGITQWEWAKHSLIKDKDSRQAILHFNNPSHQTATKDFPCTLYAIFNIRNNKLNLTSHMRSNDLIFGLSYDIPFFALLMQCMRLELIDQYPELEIGEYTHSANSMHCYEKDFGIINESLNYSFEEMEIPILTKNPILTLDGGEQFNNWLNS